MPYTFNPFTGNFDSAPSVPAVEGVYLPLSGGTVTGNLSVEGNFEVGSSLQTATMILSGNRVGINTESPNEELTVVGDISATGGLSVGTGTTTLYVENSLVGINTETPNEELTVVGDISASNIVYADGGNSDIWNESYSLIQSNSASWVSDSTVDTGVRALTSNWESTYTTVQSNSSTWDYQGSDIKALTQGWVGGNEAYTNLVANSAAYLSAVDLSFLSVSANWDSVYNTVQSNSATNWNYQGTDIKSLTSNWESTYTTFRDASSTFLTSETDSQTLSFDEITKDLSISNGNTVSLSSFNGALGNYLPLSGGTVTGNLSVEGSFEAGTNAGSTTLYVESALVGINTETPNEELTVVGDISASNIIYADGGNSVSWNEVFTSYSSNSSTFLTSETDSQTLSFDEGTKDLTISNGNTVSLSALIDATGIDTGVRALTSNWESTYNTVSALSASWSAADEVLLAQVTNADSVTLNRGDVVYSFGATGNVMSVKLASNSGDSTSATTLGVVNETIIPNGIGYVTVAGRMEKMSFPHPFVDGDILYLGNTPGTFTRVKPVAPEHGVYLGVVERANNGNGIIYIKVQNGYELNEIHDVLITSVSAGQILRRNNTNNLWINTDDGAKWDSVYSTVSSVSSTWLTNSYLSTNSITISALTVTSTISAKDQIYFNDHKAIKTTTTDAPGISAVTKIVSVSALPLIQEVNTLYILV